MDKVTLRYRETYEPHPARKHIFGDFQPARFKPACSATEAS